MSSEKRAYKKVRDQMLDLIRAGLYPAGGRLPPERELAERFGVSRPTVREAIIALETLGRVEVKVGSGVYVLDSEQIPSGTYENITPFELTESRALIEGEAAALAAKMISDEALAELERSLEEMAVETERGDLAAGDADKKFHQVIAQSTGNRMMELVIEQLWHVRNNAPQVFRAYQSVCEIDGRRRVEEHREIYDAISRRDSEAARTAMHHHFARILNKLISTMEQERVAEVQRETSEVRERFSLDHLVCSD